MERTAWRLVSCYCPPEKGSGGNSFEILNFIFFDIFSYFILVLLTTYLYI